MRVVVAGAHGQVARRLARLLTARGDTVVGLIRNPDHRADLTEDGTEPVVLDLEHATVDDVAAAVTGADGVVFAAGAGPASGPERKHTVDHAAACLGRSSWSDTGGPPSTYAAVRPTLPAARAACTGCARQGARPSSRGSPRRSAPAETGNRNA